ncbi:hypothetical protein MKK75_06155 [Methylobacterium sp. J-030]|uniref:hypothetical protein n=1 Tax=Methylobacterium sp. J-030 TaxID=2836627 RepID=UPI001FBA9DF5|nr:hypothetical protein [Methylobacterium sp. J-030]MCJ2068396.1 hypothetical protein [Methylobacterium sp. J-030]
MNTTRLIIATIAVSLSFGAAQASDPEQTGSIGASPAMAAESVSSVGRDTAVVTLPEQTVTADAQVFKPLPPLKPLPKWDPHVCIGC